MSNNGLFGTNLSAPQLRQTALQPAGIPGSTYDRSQEYEAGTNLNALANALGGLNSAISASLLGRSRRQKTRTMRPTGSGSRGVSR